MPSKPMPGMASASLGYSNCLSLNHPKRASFTALGLTILVQTARPYFARTEEFTLLPTPLPLFRTDDVCKPFGDTQRRMLKLALKAFRSVGRQSSFPKPRSCVTERGRVWNCRPRKFVTAAHCAAVARRFAGCARSGQG